MDRINKIDNFKALKTEQIKDCKKLEFRKKTIDFDDMNDVNDVNNVNAGEEETVDVVYDPVLKCYYDPKTNNYYELIP
jgi:hypothetical protein